MLLNKKLKILKLPVKHQMINFNIKIFAIIYKIHYFSLYYLNLYTKNYLILISDLFII